ncbi:hypothetical protein DFH06DRAFT_1332390 [Mycena polygramma]|nr:hypothetical protein DFH06DRAFT_1332390 [Mycena polygramma]
MAAPRLTLDPTLESCPDHASASFKSVRDLIVAGSAPGGTPLTDAEAATQLNEAWVKDRDARQVIWDAQVQADATQAAADAAAAAAQAETDRAAAEAIRKMFFTWRLLETAGAVGAVGVSGANSSQFKKSAKSASFE